MGRLPIGRSVPQSLAPPTPHTTHTKHVGAVALVAEVIEQVAYQQSSLAFPLHVSKCPWAT